MTLKRLDINAIASHRQAPMGAVEQFVALHAPIGGAEGVSAEWQRDFFAMLQESFEFGRLEGRREVDPGERRTPEEAAARTLYADAAMAYHRYPTEPNRKAAEEAQKRFKAAHHEREEVRRG